MTDKELSTDSTEEWLPSLQPTPHPRVSVVDIRPIIDAAVDQTHMEAAQERRDNNLRSADAAQERLSNRVQFDAETARGQLDTEPTPVSDAVMRADVVNHPSHYTSHPSGIECIQVTEHAGFAVGNAIKYLWRSEWGEKGTDPVEDLRKAAWYIQREIDRRSNA